MKIGKIENTNNVKEKQNHITSCRNLATEWNEAADFRIL